MSNKRKNINNDNKKISPNSNFSRRPPHTKPKPQNKKNK